MSQKFSEDLFCWWYISFFVESRKKISWGKTWQWRKLTIMRYQGEGCYPSCVGEVTVLGVGLIQSSLFKAPGNKNLVSLDILAVPWSFDISPFIGSWKLIAFMINASQCISWPEYLLTKERIFIPFGIMLYFNKHIWDYKICVLQTENNMKQNWISEVENLGGPCSHDISNFVSP